MTPIKLVVLDMAGTTVKDADAVLNCFYKSTIETGIITTRERINQMMGWSKIDVFQTLWAEQLQADALPGEKINERFILEKANFSFEVFKQILEHYYRTQPVEPTEGTLELFDFLRINHIRIALNTGFYRAVTNIILQRLGWDKDLNEFYIGNPRSVINCSIASDEVSRGRPAPDMIFRAMDLLHIRDKNTVINIGDTPSDLMAGKASGCRLALGVVNGTHSKTELEKFNNDGLLNNILELRDVISQFRPTPVEGRVEAD